jgi:hypothetical protein
MIGPRRAVSLTWGVKGWVLRRATRARLVARRLRVSQAVSIGFPMIMRFFVLKNIDHFFGGINAAPLPLWCGKIGPLSSQRKLNLGFHVCVASSNTA